MTDDQFAVPFEGAKACFKCSEHRVHQFRRLARVAGGRIFLMDDHHLGEFIVRDYVRERGDR